MNMNTNQSPRILVIDDEPDLLANCQMILAREGYEVRTLNDSLRAEQVMTEFDPDLLITDLMIPNREGM